MILLRTCDENGNNQFLPVELDVLYQECKHCGRIFPIGSICEFLKILYDEGFEIDVLNYCEDCLAERCECEAYYGEMRLRKFWNYMWVRQSKFLLLWIKKDHTQRNRRKLWRKVKSYSLVPVRERCLDALGMMWR